MNIKQFIEQFQDHLAPKLDTYEQAIYLYIFRHSRLLGADEVVIGFNLHGHGWRAEQARRESLCRKTRLTRS
jgi:hypothetical protein